MCLSAQVNGSLARAAIRELADKGLIRAVAHHGSQSIYTRSTNVEEDEKKGDKKAKKAEKAEKPAEKPAEKAPEKAVEA